MKGSTEEKYMDCTLALGASIALRVRLHQGRAKVLMPPSRYIHNLQHHTSEPLKHLMHSARHVF
jgi:hypothetical protein